MSNDGLWWVSVGGESCEPARVVDGVVFTIGCADGTPYDGSSIELVERIPKEKTPDTPKEAARKRVAWERQRSEEMRRGIYHGYRRFC